MDRDRTGVSLTAAFLFLAVLVLQACSGEVAPEQPIAFSHKTHSGTNKIDCQHCHYYARMSPVAGIPSVSTCMGCHWLVVGPVILPGILGESGPLREIKLAEIKDAEEKQKKIKAYQEVEKIRAYWDKKQTIPWIKVYDSPDFVRFNHKRHVKGGVECQTCHGKVEEMDVVKRSGTPMTTMGLIGMAPATLEMGWCLDCHNTLKENGDPKATKDCLICHY